MRIALIASLFLASLLSGCGSQPGVTITVGTQSIPMVLRSTSRITAWGQGEHGDAVPMDIPLTIVRASLPLTLQIEAGQGASLVKGWLYDKAAPTPTGGPTEEFTLPGRTGTYSLRTVVAGRTYEVIVNVVWSGFLVRGEETRAFRLKIEAP